MRSFTLRSIAALTLGLALAGSAALAFGPPLLAYRSGNVRIAAAALREALEADPDDGDLHARLGITYAMMGEYVDAAPHFTFAQGSGVYEEEGWSYHADTLRALGRGAEAAALRLERLPLLPGEKGQLDALIGATDDLRAAGELEAALELAELNLALHPSSDLARAARLDVELDRQGPDVDALLAFMDASYARSTRSLRVRVRLARMDGDLQGALTLMEGVPRRSLIQPDIIAESAELQRLIGQPEAALWTLERPMVRTPDHPALLAVRPRVLMDLGREAEATQACAFAWSRYPADPEVKRTAEELSCR
ncbi:MAG: hypothetical protein H6741_25810 [Alphaproteobacteria bacterium]|nr:hypothetical protein [Alphaproteobacteria bacterium]MCB9796128.1 hypothetical protein [Alphaproteobacteria bacterium]